MSLQVVSKQLHDALPHLRVALPTAAALVWVAHKFFSKGEKAAKRRRGEEEEEEEEEEEKRGVPITVELPRQEASLSSVSLTLPAPLSHTLLDVALKVPVVQLWEYLMSGGSGGLVEFHRSLGEFNISISTWRKMRNGDRCRVLRFTTPLKNRLGPRQARNKEIFTVVHLQSDAWIVRSRCISEGVPFSSKFANNLQWVATSLDSSTTRLQITGACKFEPGVWGPLKGTISRESVLGMSRSYKTLRQVLQTKYGIDETSIQPGIATKDIEKSNMIGLLQSPQAANPAIIVAVLAMIFIVWRMALMDAFVLHIMRKIATGNRAVT